MVPSSIFVSWFVVTICLYVFLKKIMHLGLKFCRVLIPLRGGYYYYLYTVNYYSIPLMVIIYCSFPRILLLLLIYKGHLETSSWIHYLFLIISHLYKLFRFTVCMLCSFYFQWFPWWILYQSVCIIQFNVLQCIVDKSYLAWNYFYIM